MGRYVFKLPDVGEGTAEAELVAWHVAVGDTVAEDQPLADVMTDKATVELTSPVAGVVRELHGAPGDMRAVKSELVVLETQGAGDAAGDGDQRLVPAPTGERNIDARDTPPTTPAFERPAAASPPQSGGRTVSPASATAANPGAATGSYGQAGQSGESGPSAQSDLSAQSGNACPAPNADGAILCEADATPAPPGAAGDFVFRLPDVGEGTAEAELVAWHVAVGERVEEDQPLADVMTDKATVELTSPAAGVVTALHGEPGQMIAVKAPLVELDTGKGAAPSGPAGHLPRSAGEEISSAPSSPPLRSGGGGSAEGRDGGGPAQTDAHQRAPAAAGFAPSQGAPRPPAHATRVAGQRPLASPAVRRRAHELGVQLQQVAGSGPAGRISHADLDAHLKAGAAPVALAAAQPAPASAPGAYARREGVDELKVIGLRRRIAAQMAESKRRIPHFGYVESCDVTELEDLRAHLNATRRADQPKLTVLPFLVRALCRALPAYPNINARFDDEAGVLHRHAGVHLGVATMTPNGLIVPVIRHAEALDVWALAAEIARLARACREGTARKEELSGSTLTLTSLGTLGGVSHTPVINHPETGIVGPNKIVETPVVRGGSIVVRKMMNVSSSFDHRVVDGYDAAEFIQAVKGMLEHPATLFM